MTKVAVSLSTLSTYHAELVSSYMRDQVLKGSEKWDEGVDACVLTYACVGSEGFRLILAVRYEPRFLVCCDYQVAMLVLRGFSESSLSGLICLTTPPLHCNPESYGTEGRLLVRRVFPHSDRRVYTGLYGL